MSVAATTVSPKVSVVNKAAVGFVHSKVPTFSMNSKDLLHIKHNLLILSFSLLSKFVYYDFQVELSHTFCTSNNPIQSLRGAPACCTWNRWISLWFESM